MLFVRDLSNVSICLVYDFSFEVICSPAFLLVCVLIVFISVFVVVLSGEPKQNQGRGLVDYN